MKRHITAACCVALALSASVIYAGPTMMSIQVDKRELRSGSTFFDSVTGNVSYGDRVEVLQELNGWAQVKVEGTGLTGWIHSSALTKKKIVLRAGDKDADVGASSGELALARKGFNQDVENAYRQDNPAIDFAPVDKMEKMKAQPMEIKSFLEQGSVSASTGGAK